MASTTQTRSLTSFGLIFGSTLCRSTGQVMGQSNDVSDDFEINAGVRQGCVLSPRLFCAALQEAMRSRRDAEERNGLNLQGGLQHLLGLRFADDILLFAETSHHWYSCWTH